MKKNLIFLCLLVWIVGAVRAQENNVRYEKTAEDVLRWHELSERMRTSTPEP